MTNSFHKFLDDSGRKSNKIWLDKGSEFYNRLMKFWLNKIYKDMTSISKHVYIDNLADIVNKHNST